MTTPPKATRYHISRVERPAAGSSADSAGMFDTHDDGFGNLDFRRPEAGSQSAPHPAPQSGDAPAADAAPAPAAPGVSATVLRVPRDNADTPAAEATEAALAAIAAEGLTSRQLRRARLFAQKQGLTVSSDLDAVRQLRQAGVDPFSRASMLKMVTPSAKSPDPAAPKPPGRELARLPGDVVQLPQKSKPINLPSTEQRAEVNQAAEILRMQQDIARRRRRRLALLAARLFAFVALPTIFAGWYFYTMATPMYATKTEFVIQQAGPASSGGQFGGLFSGTAFATSQDSIAVQGYLQSLDAMVRLEGDLGFREHFQNPAIDALQRLDADATMNDAYKIYKKYVKISYDPSEGIVRMEVIAADPQVAAKWSEQLISYAEEQVDHLTQRLRADQMSDAQKGYDDAQAALTASQRRLIELQERFKVLSSATEEGLITAQISTLETQLTQDRLSLAQMEANESPNLARMEPLKRRIATLESEIATLRARLTEGELGELSLAQVQGELLVAQADLQTRQMILAQSLQSMETSRVEANRQVRYLSLSVHPVPPDAPAYPRAFENTAVTMLIMLGIYLMVSMTAAILREQVSA
jgi:capsular polysaccharide transport system permease protein